MSQAHTCYTTIFKGWRFLEGLADNNNVTFSLDPLSRWHGTREVEGFFGSFFCTARLGTVYVESLSWNKDGVQKRPALETLRTLSCLQPPTISFSGGSG